MPAKAPSRPVKNGSSLERSQDGMLPISLDTLCPTAGLSFDLFVRPDPQVPAVLYRECSVPLKAEDIERLRGSGVQTLFIRVADHSRYSRYVREEVIASDRVPPAQRYDLLRKVSRATFESAFTSGSTDRVVRFAGEFATQMTDVICSQDLVLSDLFSLVEHDYYTYTHVTNVSAYSLALAAGLGITEHSDLVAIAAGALVHDLGKRHIAPYVLNKNGPLSDEDWRQIRRHPTLGFQELCFREDLVWGQLMMVYQHHERLDRRGYPVRLSAEEIHPWTRICSIADVFDALTSERPYRKAIPLEKVLTILQGDSGTAFDKEMVQCWIAQAKPHPSPK